MPALAFSAVQTPHECLQMLQKAVTDCNAQDFEKYCDLEAILEEGLTAFIRSAQKDDATTQFPPVLNLLLSQLSGEKGRAIKNVLLAETRAFILNCINSGAFAGKKLPGASQQGLLAPLFATASLGEKKIVDIGESVKYGDGWLCDFTVHDVDNGQDYLVRGKFAPHNGICRLAGIENFDCLIDQIQLEEQDY